MFKWLWGYLCFELIVFILVMVVMGVVVVIEGIILKVVKDLLDQGFGGEYVGRLWQVLVMLVGIVVVCGIVQFVLMYLLSLVLNKVLLNLWMKMFECLLQVFVLYYQCNMVVLIINVVIFEVNQVLQVFIGVFIMLVCDLMIVLVLLIFFFYINWCLMLVVVVILLIIGLLMLCINCWLCLFNCESQNLINQVVYVVEEVVGGYKVVKLYGGEVYELLCFNVMMNCLCGYVMCVVVVGGLNQLVMQFLVVLVLLIILVIVMMQVQVNQIMVGGFIGFVMVMLLLILLFKYLIDVNQLLQCGLIVVEFIFGLIDILIEL